MNEITNVKPSTHFRIQRSSVSSKPNLFPKVWGVVDPTEIIVKERSKEEIPPSNCMGHWHKHPRAKAFSPLLPCPESLAGIFHHHENIWSQMMAYESLASWVENLMFNLLIVLSCVLWTTLPGSQSNPSKYIH